MNSQLERFTDVLIDPDEIGDSQPLSLSLDENVVLENPNTNTDKSNDQLTPKQRPAKGTGQCGQFRSVEEIDEKYRCVFSYPFFNLVQSNVIDDALYTDKSMVVSAPTGSGKTVVFEMAIVQLLMEMEDNNYTDNFKIIYMAPVKALCTERLTEWYPKFTKLGLFCIEVTGDTDVDFSQLAPYRIIITTPEKWDMLTRRWRDYRGLVEQIKLFLIDEVHILNDCVRGPVLEAVVSRMKTIESSAQSAHRIEQLQKQYRGEGTSNQNPPKIRFVAVSATVGNPDDVASWLGNENRPAVYYTFGDESRPVKLRRVVEGYPCSEGTSIFKFDIILNYKLWPIIQKYHDGKPTLIFCNTRKSVLLTAETLSREITITFNPEQKAKLTALASTFKNKKLQSLVLSGVGCHHAGLLFEERTNIEHAFRNRDLPILITTTTLAMGVNLPAHLVIIKNTQQYVNGAYQEYSISTVLQMVGRAGRPQYDTEATAVIMTRLCDKGRYQALVGGSEPLQSYLHKRLAENLNSEAALGTVGDVAQCVQWLRSTFLFVRAARDPKRYLGLPQAAPQNQISKKIEELCVKAMNGLASSGLITMDEASCIESTEAGRLMSIYYLDLETMKQIMKINGTETLEQLLRIVCESHELSDMHLRVDERRYLNALNRNNAAATIRFPMKGKITTRQMKVNCLIQAILGCLPISDPSLNQEAMKIMRIADRVCKCLIAYVTQQSLLSANPKYYSAVLNSAILAKCVFAHLWENSPYVSKQLRGIGPTFSTLLATAGKVNFMTLEESHPRDLERIMKKGPPAGNVLRKQVSLLPKYQLTMTPVDEKSVIVQLDLLNCSYLVENIDNLTAGTTHKSYIIVGDSENNILWFRAFNDNTLISVYNGTITFTISRIHSFEHKIFAHCISSTFAGIDANCDYVFMDLGPHPETVNDKSKIPTLKQTTISDTFKERKRKCSNSDITQSKEKKKRDSNPISKFKCLKESFGKTSKVMRDLERTPIISNEILKDFDEFYEPIDISIEDSDSHVKPIELIGEQSIQNNNTNFYDISCGVIPLSMDDCNDQFDEINDIIREIESERTHGSKPNQSRKLSYSENITSIDSPQYQNTKATIESRNDTTFKCPNTTQLNKKCTKNILPVKSNYNFIDLLEKNVDLNDDEEKEQSTVKQSEFSLNVKQYIDKYLIQVQKQNKVPDKDLTELIETPNKNTNETINSKCTDNSDLPEYVELNKVKTLPIIIEQDEIIENSPNNKDVFSPIQKVIKTLESNEQSKTQDTIQNCYTTELKRYHNEENNFVITEQNEKIYPESSNNEATVNDEHTKIEPKNQNESPSYTEINYANNCYLTNDMPHITNVFHENFNRGISTLQCAKPDTEGQIQKVIKTLESNEQLKTQDSTKNYADTTELKRSHYEENNANVVMTEQNEKIHPKISNTERTVNDENTKIESHRNESPTYTEINYANSCYWTNDMPHMKNGSHENVDRQISTLDCAKRMKIQNSVGSRLEYKDLNANFHSSTNIQDYSDRNVAGFEEDNTNTIKFQLFNKNTNAINIDDEQLKMRRYEMDQQKCPLVSQLINKTKSFTLEDSHKIAPITTEENTHNQVCTGNIPCNKATRKSNDGFTEFQKKNQSEYIKKYSYSSGQTNVITNVNNDSIVRITRRLQLNLDITEILQKDTISKNMHNSSTIIGDPGTKAVIDDVTIPTNNFDNDQFNKAAPQRDFNDKFYSADLTIKNKLPITYSRHMGTLGETSGENGKEIVTEHSSPFDSCNAITDSITAQDFELEFKDNESTKEHKNETNCDQIVLSKSTEENSNTANENKDIKNILHKYSEIMRKKTRDDVNNQNANENIKFRPNKSQTVVPKRPFKISDISKCNSQLPNIIPQKSKPIPQNIFENKVTITKVQKPKPNFKPLDFLEPNKCDPMLDKENEIPVLDIDVIESNYYQPLEDINTLNDKEEMNIDPTMFNPKTLLQCFSNEDDEADLTLIPPPPEFCNSDSNSSNVSSKEIELPAESYDPKDWIEDFDYVRNSSIFQTDLDVDLTPTKEIETWCLSQDHENHNTPSFRFQPSTQSYTVLNENSFNDSHYRATNNRHTKLGKFKFSRKRKLKL